jgi:hypothetical protein
MPEGLLGDSPVHKLYAHAVGDGMTDLTGTEFIERLSRLPLLHRPGTVWHYGCRAWTPAAWSSPVGTLGSASGSGSQAVDESGARSALARSAK